MNNTTVKTNNKQISKLQKYTDIFCDHCGSNNLRKYGKDPKTHLQKYQCKICLKQFVPGKQKSLSACRKHIHGNCPLCGGRLDIRKTNKSSIQLRCSNRPICKYTISFNFKLKKSFYDAAVNSKNFFYLPKFFKFPQEVVLCALRYYFKYKLSLREIKQELKVRFPNLNKFPSHVSILKWANKLSYLMSLSLLNPTFKSSSYWLIWLIDDTAIKINGCKYYLIVVLDYYSGCVLSWFLSPTKDSQAVQFALQLAKQLTKSSPKLIISDHAQNIQLAVNLCFENSVNHLQVDLYSNNTISNNKLERFFSSTKEKLKSTKAFRSFNSAVAFFAVFFILHNIKKSFNPIPYLSLSKNPLVRSFLLCLA